MLHKEKPIPTCKGCGRRLPENHEGDYCPACQDRQLFAEVRDYIRENDVRAWQVAEHFGIPLERVKRWIQDGRIQYKDDQTPRDVLMESYCEVCGKRIDFGTVCPACMKEIRSRQRHGSLGTPANSEAGKMRFFEDK